MPVPSPVSARIFGANGFAVALAAVVFLSGAIVMVYEIVGSRVLAPYVGTSTLVWTSLIGVILGALSLGYSLGGKAADRYPSPRGLASLLALAAALIILTAITKESVLSAIADAGFGLKTASLLAAVLLFAPASVMLGMVSPYAVKLKLSNLAASGATVGNLYALSTLGSIAGTFVAGFYLVPAFGVTDLLFLLAILLFGLSILLAPFHFLAGKAAGIFVCLLLTLFGDAYLSYAANSDYPTTEINTVYNRVLVQDKTRTDETGRVRPIRELMISNEHSSAMFLDGPELVYEYTKYYHLARHFFPGFQSALMLGGAGYSYPKEFLRVYPAATLDVVEIDPGLTQVARDHFGLKDDPRLTIIHEDARTYLNRADKTYDVIYGDAFASQYSLPFHLTTVETARKKYDLLSDNGVVIINVIAAINGELGEFLRAELVTYKAVFPQVFVFPVRGQVLPDGEFFTNDLAVQNIALVALKSPQVPNFESDDPELAGYLRHLWRQEIPLDQPVLTDEYAPVDPYINKILKGLKVQPMR